MKDEWHRDMPEILTIPSQEKLAAHCKDKKSVSSCLLCPLDSFPGIKVLRIILVIELFMGSQGLHSKIENLTK